MTIHQTTYSITAHVSEGRHDYFRTHAMEVCGGLEVTSRCWHALVDGHAVEVDEETARLLEHSYQVETGIKAQTRAA